MWHINELHALRLMIDDGWKDRREGVMVMDWGKWWSRWNKKPRRKHWGRERKCNYNQKNLRTISQHKRNLQKRHPQAKCTMHTRTQEHAHTCDCIAWVWANHSDHRYRSWRLEDFPSWPLSVGCYYAPRQYKDIPFLSTQTWASIYDSKGNERKRGKRWSIQT